MIAVLGVLFLVTAGTAIFLSISTNIKQEKIAEEKTEKVEKSTSKRKEEKKSIESASERNVLNKELVNQFVAAYYNRTDYGSNREQYRPFVTESYYNALVNNEDKVINAGWNGHTVDRKLDKTEIFLDSDAMTALVEVDYKMTYLSKRFDYNGLKNEDIPQHDQIKVKYIQAENGEYLVDDVIVETSSATTHDHTHDEDEHNHGTSGSQPAVVSNGETHYGHD